MRVIAGEFRSRRIKSVPGIEVRPTPDRLREALFNVLAPRIGGAVFLDCYAGSGSVGIEALSRGAKRVIFIEKNGRALEALRVNLKSLGIEERAVVSRVLRKEDAADIAFIDPPYHLEGEYLSTLEALSAARCGFVVAQHATRFVLEEQYGLLTKTRVLRQGDNCLSFFEVLAGE
jgi:16S rRNA (guanine(966)-N(2))-methyltransferase RsmD